MRPIRTLDPTRLAALFTATASGFALLLAASCGEVTPVAPIDDVDSAGPEEVFVIEAVVHQQIHLPIPPLVSTIALPLHERAGPPYPIVLVHGFTGFTDLGPLDYFFRVVDLFEDLGGEAFAPAQPPYNSSESRARVLGEHVEQVLLATDSQKVHLVCHSQGGLDCRQLVAHVETMEDKVATITTIATPHHGTPLADAAVIAPDGILNPAGQFLGWFLGALEGEPPDESDWNNDSTVTTDEWDPNLSDAVHNMTSEGAEEFNAATPDTSVPVFSIAGYSNLAFANEVCDDGLLFGRTNRVDAQDLFLLGTGLYMSGLNVFSPRLNDGVVPTDSMKWGTFLGCVPADHLDEVGQIADLSGGLISGFDHLEMYEELYFFLRDWETENEPSSEE